MLDTWESFVSISLDDPKQLLSSKTKPSPMPYADGGYNGLKAYPKTVGVLHFTTKREWNDVCNDHCKPRSEVIDADIVEVTLDHFVSAELRGGRGGYSRFNCARCGSGLGLRECSACKVRFDDDEYRCGGDTPLSRKMVQCCVQAGLSFETDPELAMKAERNHWAKYYAPEEAANEVVSEPEPNVDRYSQRNRERTQRLDQEESLEIQLERIANGSTAAADLLKSMVDANISIKARHPVTTNDVLRELDSARLYGDKLVALHNEVCGGDFAKLFTVMYAHYLSQISTTALHAMAEGRVEDVGAAGVVAAVDAYFDRKQSQEAITARRIRGALSLWWKVRR